MSDGSKLSGGWFVGELLGTFILVFFGCGSVATAVLTGAQIGIFQVAIVWGIGVALAIYLTASISGAHLNPAMTIAFAVWSDFRWRWVPRYIAAQFVGAMLASAVLFVAYRGVLEAYETSHGVVRGTTGSEATAMIFGEYFPNPAGRPLTAAARQTVSTGTAFLVEVVGTAILSLAVFGLTDKNNRFGPGVLTAAMIGLTVTILISLLGPLTMAAFNPARDLGPRVFSYFAGWGPIVFTTNGVGWLTVYVIAPIAGALIGGGIYRTWLAPNYTTAQSGG